MDCGKAVGQKILNRDEIKLLAMITMLLNHIANLFIEPGTPLHMALIDIGYFTMPVMCWFLAVVAVLILKN